MFERSSLVNLWATSLVNSRWEEAALVECSRQFLGQRNRAIGPLIRRLLDHFPGPTRPRAAAIAAFILDHFDFAGARLPRRWQAWWSALPVSPMASSLPSIPDIPAICTTAELANWLEISLGELDWFADRKSLARRCPPGKLHHYHYRLLSKRFGAVRLIESPKLRLKAIQRRLLREILDQIAPHDAAHGFRLGRSIQTFVIPHVAQTVVARVDLRDFFPCIHRARVAALYRTIGYPERVADLLAGLCTSVAPSWVWDAAYCPASRESLRAARTLYAVPHLPQGAPTSPAIANLCAYRVDCRLAGLARAAGANYTRYADDLAFSGDRDFARRVKRFLIHVTATAAEEGFTVHHRKTRIMRQGVRQHLAGIVVNRHPNIRRLEFDRLKAILVNCRRHGPENQNHESHPDFRAHLNGRVAFVEQLHPARGNRLRKLFDAISW